MDEKLSVLFQAVGDAFGKHPIAVDIQSDSMDILELAQTVTGEKDIFIGMVEDQSRAAPYNDAIAVARGHGLLAGSGLVNVHHRYRPLNISNDEIVKEIEARSTTKTRIVWATKRPDLHELLQCGDASSRKDSELLGYPHCCATWHYDCYFARGTEAFADAYVKQTSLEDALAVIRDGWRPMPGWFLPRNYYLAGILASNHIYPFIGHIACPTCRQTKSSPSQVRNHRNSEVVRVCDPVRHESVLRFAKALPSKISTLISRPADSVMDEIGDYDWNVRAVDAYTRHSRYLLKAIGVSHLSN